MTDNTITTPATTVSSIVDALVAQLVDWVARMSANGIKQHSREWLEAKWTTIGGSSIATIAGKNPYKDMVGLLRERIGYDPFVSRIALQWGNLFEEVIKRYVEAVYTCVVYGEDLYVEAAPRYPGVAYSPDGLAVITAGDHPMVVLMEFKCPYSRIPTKAPTPYYVPQVKMGLDVCDIAQMGMLVEAVYRRCTFDQLADTPEHDVSLVPDTKTSAAAFGLPLCIGLIGLYVSPDVINLVAAEPSLGALLRSTCAALSKIEGRRGIGSDRLHRDLGAIPPALFTNVIDLVDRGVFCAWYGRVIGITDDISTDGPAALTADLAAFDVAMRGADISADSTVRSTRMPIGVLPWKCFHVTTNYITKEPNWLAQHMSRIQEILDISARCNAAANEDEKRRLYNAYTGQPETSSPTSCYSDGW